MITFLLVLCGTAWLAGLVAWILFHHEDLVFAQYYEVNKAKLRRTALRMLWLSPIYPVVFFVVYFPRMLSKVKALFVEAWGDAWGKSEEERFDESHFKRSEKTNFKLKEAK